MATRVKAARPWWVSLIFVLLLVTPLAEIAVIIGVGKVIGGWQTLALLLVESAIGAWLVRREGAATWTALRDALNTGRMPARELTEAALVLIGGALLLTPGFLTDLVGYTLIAPPTRPIARRWLQVVVERQLVRRSGIVPGRVV